MRAHKTNLGKIVIFLTITVLFILANKLYAQPTIPNDLSFTITIDKEEYLVNEPIWITLTLQNTSSLQVYETSLNPSDNYSDFFIISSKEDTLKGGYVSFLRGPGAAPTIDPNEKDIYFVNPLGPMVMLGIETEEAVFDRIIPEGRYTVQVKLRVWTQINGKKQKFSILSNKLKFKVLEPQGVEKRVYDLLVEGVTELRRALKEKGSPNGMENFGRIIDEFPHSVYVDAAYHKLYHIFDKEDNVRKFIDKYPNSGMVRRILRLNAPKEKDKRKQFFEKIIKSYPDTKASACAEILLDKWKRGKLWPDEKIK